MDQEIDWLVAPSSPDPPLSLAEGAVAEHVQYEDALILLKGTPEDKERELVRRINELTTLWATFTPPRSIKHPAPRHLGIVWLDSVDEPTRVYLQDIGEPL